MYKIYTRYNAADTFRDPDEIVITEIGYTETFEEAEKVTYEYMQKYFDEDVSNMSIEPEMLRELVTEAQTAEEISGILENYKNFGKQSMFKLLKK